MDKKTYLSRYHNLVLKMNHLKNDINRCQELADSIPGPKFDDMPRNPNRNTDAPFVKWILRKIENEHELERLEPEAERLRNETLDAIANIGDTELESVLIHRYIYWKSWNEISDLIFASSSTVRRLHNKAMEQFNIPE